MLSQAAKRAYESRLLEIVKHIRDRTFENNASLAKQYELSPSTTSTLKHTIVVERKMITEAEWNAGFTKRHQKRAVFRCPQCDHTWTGKYKPSQDNTRPA